MIDLIKVIFTTGTYKTPNLYGNCRPKTALFNFKHDYAMHAIEPVTLIYLVYSSYIGQKFKHFLHNIIFIGFEQFTIIVDRAADYHKRLFHGMATRN